MNHAFWWILSWACVAWYSTLTFYVAGKGFHEIRVMLKALEAGGEPKAEDRVRTK